MSRMLPGIPVRLLTLASGALLLFYAAAGMTAEPDDSDPVVFQVTPAEPEAPAVLPGFIEPDAPTFEEEQRYFRSEGAMTAAATSGRYPVNLAGRSELALSDATHPSSGCADRCRPCLCEWQCRLPDMMGDLLRLGGTSDSIFRPRVVNPPASTGIVVLDVANNRLTFVDAANELLVPGNTNLVPGTTFEIFRAPGGGVLTETTNAMGLTGHFGVDRFINDVGTGGTTVQPDFDVLNLGTTQTIIDPISAASATSFQHTAHFRIMTTTSANPGFGNVGLVKQSMGGSPLVRDRVFFHYDFFDNVPLNGGINVNRFVPGFEHRIFDNLTSIEARFPFATTLDADLTVNGSTNSWNAEFGDMTLALKRILSQGDNWVLSAGLQMSLPTSADLSYRITDGTTTAEFLRIENETVHLMPFIGGAVAPTERSFIQGFVQLDFDASGKPVLANANALNGGSLADIGRLNDSAFIYADLNAGYWLMQEPLSSDRTLTGVAPMWELHYNASISDSDQLTFLPLGTLGQSGQDVEFLTTTIGCVFEFHHSANLTVGYSVPLAGGSDEEYDGHFRAMYTQRFGSR